MKKNKKDNKKKLKDMEKQANEDIEQTQEEVVDEKKDETSATEEQCLEGKEESSEDETEKNRGLGKSKKDKKFEKLAEEKAELEEKLTELEEKLSALEKLASENKEKYLRLFSEFDNYKKRVAKEKIELIDSASAETIKKLLPVLDDIDRANEMMDKATDVQAVKDGCNLIFDKFKNTLTSCGLAEMETTGDDFDADKHYAITKLPVAEDQKNKIIDTTKKGYTLNGKIIRYPQVVVGC